MISFMSNKSEKTPTAYFLWVCKHVFKSTDKGPEEGQPYGMLAGEGTKTGLGHPPRPHRPNVYIIFTGMTNSAVCLI